MIFYNVENTERWMDLKFVTDSTNFPAFSAATASFDSVNGFVRPIVAKGDTNGIYAALIMVLNEIQIPIDWQTKPDWVSPNHCAIFIKQRPQ
jgi:hypothetical protein